LKAVTSGPSIVQVIDGSIIIVRSWIEYSGNKMRSVAGYTRLVWRTREQTCSVAFERTEGVWTLKSWDCTAAITIPPEVLLRPPGPLILALGGLGIGVYRCYKEYGIGMLVVDEGPRYPTLKASE